jgi:hypothetical protein
MSDWATEQERMRHNEALYWVGEYCALFLMWHIADFQAGLVTRCTRCYSTNGSKEQRAANVYNQPTQNKCPDCFGTTFEGGYRARIIRPVIFADVDETDKTNAKGQQHPGQTTMETTVDFKMREGDFVIRADDTRWRTTTPRRTLLRVGFGHPTHTQNAISYNNASVALEDRTSVAYELPTLHLSELLHARSYVPLKFSSWEQLRGPLVPDGIIT